MTDHCNHVELIGVYGSDETHAASAWTSTSRDLTDEKRVRIPKLLRMLASEGHHTPFEKSTLHFLATTEIATHIHLLKHRIGVSLNSESARYKELNDDKFYVPSDWPNEEIDLYTQHAEEAYQKYHTCMERLITAGMSRKRAKESARFYLPYGMQYTVDLSFNFRSFYHFIKLRYSHHAQKEVRDLAFNMLCLVRETKSFNNTLEAFDLFNDCGQLREPF